jgi:hypothetical protein
LIVPNLEADLGFMRIGAPKSAARLADAGTERRERESDGHDRRSDTEQDQGAAGARSPCAFIAVSPPSFRQYASVARIRNEFRRSIEGHRPSPTLRLGCSCRQPSHEDRGALAQLLLDAYRGTVDDEGETIAEALEATDRYLQRIVPEYSLVLERGDALLAMAFTVVVRGTHYIDPVATASAVKRTGVGAGAASAVLALLRDGGIMEVGAVITEGNVASERLFLGLGFERVGEWQ